MILEKRGMVVAVLVDDAVHLRYDLLAPPVEAFVGVVVTMPREFRKTSLYPFSCGVLCPSFWPEVEAGKATAGLVVAYPLGDVFKPGW